MNRELSHRKIGALVFGWPSFDPNNLFAGTDISRAWLAAHLAQLGRTVVMAYAGPPGAPSERLLHSWVAERKEPHLRAITVPEWNGSSRSQHFRRDRAHEFYRWLRDMEDHARIESILVPDTEGIAYYALLARQAGIAFADVNFTVDAAGPLRFCRGKEARGLERIEDLTIDFMERRSLELADHVVASGQELIDWCQEQRWRLPENKTVLAPFPIPGTERQIATGVYGDARLRHLVVATPIAEGGNIRAACETLRALAGRMVAGRVELTFWGPVGKVGLLDAPAYLRDRLEGSGISWRIERDLSAKGLLALASVPGSLFVFPAGPTAAPTALAFAVSRGVATASTRTPARDYEMISGGGDAAPKHDMLTALSRYLEEGVPHPPPAHLTPADVKSAWTDLTATGARPGASRRPSPTIQNPRVSVCLATRNRPSLLMQAVASLETQDYPNFEVLLVDDGSDMPEAVDLIGALVARFAARGWRVLRQPHRFHTVGRNWAAREATGEYLLFMDDDNIAEPNEVSVFVRAALATDADLLTCGRYMFEGDGPPTITATPHRIWMPLGNIPVLGLIQNCAGDMNFFVRRETFIEMGGFYTRSRGYAFDRDFFRRAWLAGKRLEVVPEILYHYRLSATSLSGMRKRWSGGLARDHFIARCYADLMPEDLRDLPGLVQALHRQAERSERHKTIAAKHLRRAIRAERGLAARHPLFALAARLLNRFTQKMSQRFHRTAIPTTEDHP